MNGPTPPPSSPPPPLFATPAYPPLGEAPEDNVEPRGIGGVIDAMLRNPRRLLFQLRRGQASAVLGVLAFLIVSCTLIYGLIVGSFSGGVQWWAAPLKISAGLLLSGAICLPSLYIFSCLGGSQARVMEVLGILLGLLTLTAILLIGFAPVAWIFSQSMHSVAGMGFLHLLFWIVSLGFGARFMTMAFRTIGIRSASGVKLWVLIFFLVTMQMTTTLRPLVGKADTLLPREKKFFLTHWTECVYGRGAGMAESAVGEKAPAQPEQSQPGK